jgi:F0F1-type ATP synthase assembly protein I
LAIFFGLVPIVFFLLVTLVIASALFGTKALGPWTLWSFVPAVAINVLLLKKWVKGAYQMSGKALVSVYLFYSIIGLGMCMGIPLISFILGIAAGPYAARRMQLAQSDEQTGKQYFKKTAFFSAAVMAIMCCLITLWAIAGQMIGYRIDTFTITAPIFLAIVLTGGIVAVTLQYFVTLAAAKLMLRFLSSFSS